MHEIQWMLKVYTCLGLWIYKYTAILAQNQERSHMIFSHSLGAVQASVAIFVCVVQVPKEDFHSTRDDTCGMWRQHTQSANTLTYQLDVSTRDRSCTVGNISDVSHQLQQPLHSLRNTCDTEEATIFNTSDVDNVFTGKSRAGLQPIGRPVLGLAASLHW